MSPAPSEPVPRVTRRPLTAGDDDLSFRVYASTRAEELAVTDWDDARKQAFLRQQWSAQTQYYRENYPGAEFLALEHGGEAVGRLFLHRRADEIRLVDIALLPEHRGRGLGRTVLLEVMDEARRAGKALRIHVERFNPALRLYERLGFRQIDDRGVYLFLEWSPAPGAWEPSA